ncbi:MAG: hypothetical protein L3J75_02395 [Methylococcaceae bacterium]|nr:hypothetical protein [Methylococcaceae bacterium]
MKIVNILLVFTIIALLSACATRTRARAPTYLAPSANVKTDFFRIIPVNYDDAWGGMIDYVSTTFFTIKDFEKDSGLLTLVFGESNISKYVNCGTWDGQPYIDRDNSGFSLTGRMNIRIKDLGKQGTSIRVSTNYILRDDSGNVYSFRENNPAIVHIKNRTKGTPLTRTCQSTQAAEKIIITGIDAFSKQ